MTLCYSKSVFCQDEIGIINYSLSISLSRLSQGVFLLKSRQLERHTRPGKERELTPLSAKIGVGYSVCGKGLAKKNTPDSLAGQHSRGCQMKGEDYSSHRTIFVKAVMRQ